jgi:hypothetical protein
VPGHIGTPTPGCGYEAGDPFADFLPPPVVLEPDDDGNTLRAVLTGEEYERSTFAELHTRICDALRGSRPRVVMEAWGGDGSVSLRMEDGSSRELDAARMKKRLRGGD